jgi:hypothetical protein
MQPTVPIVLEPYERVKLDALKDALLHPDAPSSGFACNPMVYRYMTDGSVKIHAYPQAELYSREYRVPYLHIKDLASNKQVWFRIGAVQMAKQASSRKFELFPNLIAFQAVRSRSNPDVYQPPLEYERIDQRAIMNGDKLPGIWPPTGPAYLALQVLILDESDLKPEHVQSVHSQFEHPKCVFLASFVHPRTKANRTKRVLTPEQKETQRKKSAEARKRRKANENPGGAASSSTLVDAVDELIKEIDASDDV